MTNLPNSEQAGNLDNLAVTRSEFRAEIGVLLEYIAQALGDVSGTYTTETVDPLKPVLQGEPKLEVGAVPAAADDSTRIPTTSWVKKNGTYVSGTAPTGPADGTLWVDTTTSPYQLKAYDLGGASWDVMSGFEPGTKMLFQQSAAPVGWTKDTTHNNKALRVVSGSVTTGGTLSFTDAFKAGIGLTGTIGATALTVDQLPSHTHGGAVDDVELTGKFTPGAFAPFWNIPVADRGICSDGGNVGSPETGDSRNGHRVDIDASHGHTVTIQPAGAGQTHTHTFTGGSIGLDVAYCDVIIAVRS